MTPLSPILSDPFLLYIPEYPDANRVLVAADLFPDETRSALQPSQVAMVHTPRHTPHDALGRPHWGQLPGLPTGIMQVPADKPDSIGHP